MADKRHEPVFVHPTESDYSSLAKFVAREFVEMVRKDQVKAGEDVSSDDGKDETFQRIKEGVLSDKGDHFLNAILAEVSLQIFTYGKK